MNDKTATEVYPGMNVTHPYTCPKCGNRFSGPYVRCIGSAKTFDHAPVTPIISKRTP